MRSRLSAGLLSLLVVGAVALAACSPKSSTNTSTKAPEATKSESMQGKKIEMSVLGIAGWVPSKLSVDLATEKFTKYAKDKYGYDVTFKFAEAPFSALFQKGAAALATKSQEYNIIISDSQWLGAFAKPGWIVKVNDLLKENPDLNVTWFSDTIKSSYQVYPDGSDQLWGLPQEADTIVLYVRKDLLTDNNEKAAFKAKYGWDLPQSYEDFEKLTMDKFESVAEFFTRADKGLYGTAMQFSKEYDFITCYLYPFMFSTGGQAWEPNEGKVYGVLNSDGNAKALPAMKKMLTYMPPGAINYGISEETDAFTQGKLFSAFQWAAMGPAMIPDSLKGKVMVVPPPGFGSDVKRVYTVGGQPWVINKFNDADHMRVAIDFLKWWYLPETQLEYAKRGGNPSDKATLTAPGFDDIQPWFRAYKYMLQNGRSTDFWHDPKYSEMLAAQQEAFTAYMTGQINDPKQALEYAACHQQQVLFDEGVSKIAPPATCKDVRLK